MIDLRLGEALAILRTMPDNSVDAVVCDPPYGISFMSKHWDYDIPSVDIWQECFRVLKPGGHLLAFAGTRTQHRMAVRIEDAGFEIRDMIAWVYGCLSEDSEVLTEDGWMRYNSAKQKQILTYDIQNDVYQWEKPSRWNEYRVESDTAYRIQSDDTDQIVSRGHRCVVERGGMLTFVPADELASVERMPYLPDDFSSLPEGRGKLLLETVLREGEGLAQAAFSERQGQEMSVQGSAGREESGMEGRADLLQAQGEIPEPVDQVRPMPGGVPEHGKEGWVCHGASTDCGDGTPPPPDAQGVRASRQSRCDGQQAGEPDAVCQQCGSQEVRARAGYRTTVAAVTKVEHSGLIWCPTVSTGAFVARRNGKVFITGNSGFPKSMDVSKAIDKAAGVEFGSKPAQGVGFMGEDGPGGYNPTKNQLYRVGESTAAAKQWKGFGTGLKPALEPITVARKPLIGTVVENVLQHGTGALNIDGCRVPLSGASDAAEFANNHAVTERLPQSYEGQPLGLHDGGWKQRVGEAVVPPGRWPANLVLDGSDDVIGAFPDAKGQQGDLKETGRARPSSGRFGDMAPPVAHKARVEIETSAARFFYAAKASRKDRGEGNSHPTVKPTDLMRYLCRLVTPPGGVILDPFMGSGSTGKAAVAEGFKFIGIEMVEEYFAIAHERITGEPYLEDLI